MTNKMKVLNLGDIVKITKGGKSDFEGLKGKVVCFASNQDMSVGVEFENKIRGCHDCNGFGRDSHCYYFTENQLTLTKRAKQYE